MAVPWAVVVAATAGLDRRQSREAASLLARHRLASIGGRVERLHACWLGTGWRR